MKLKTLIDELEKIKRNAIADGICEEDIIVAIWNTNIDPDTSNTESFEVFFEKENKEVWIE